MGSVELFAMVKNYCVFKNPAIYLLNSLCRLCCKRYVLFLDVGYEMMFILDVFTDGKWRQIVYHSIPLVCRSGLCQSIVKEESICKNGDQGCLNLKPLHVFFMLGHKWFVLCFDVYVLVVQTCELYSICVSVNIVLSCISFILYTSTY